MKLALWCAAVLALAPAVAALFGAAYYFGPAAIALLIVLLALGPRWKWGAAAAGDEPRFAYAWAVGLAAAVAILFTAASLGTFDLPHGDWDAWSIWNLHARFLAGRDVWQNVASPLAFRSHPDYPLLLPFIVALFGHAAWVAVIFAAAAALALFGAVARLRGLTAGFLALLTLAASAGYVTQIPSQYADVPLSALIVLSLGLLLVHAPGGANGLWLSGLAAGAAAFTKNEGIVFALALVALGGVATGLGGFRRILAGAAPGLAITAWFKLVYAPPTPYADTRLGQFFDGGRWAEILGRLPGELFHLGIGAGHPLLILAVLALGLRFAPVSRVWRFAAAVTGCQLLGYLAAYLLTPDNLSWQLDTSMSRLLGQVWPAMLLLFFTALAPLESPYDDSDDAEASLVPVGAPRHPRSGTAKRRKSKS